MRNYSACACLTLNSTYSCIMPIAKKYSNKQEARELAQLIANLKNFFSRIEPELNQLRARRAELERELESVKAAINCHESNLVQIPNAIK